MLQRPYKSFRVDDDLLNLELVRMLNDHLSRWAMQHMAMAYLEIEYMLTNLLAMSTLSVRIDLDWQQ